MRIHELFYLKREELRRTLPFFGFYLLLFGAFSLADGLSLALFVQRVGAAKLPMYYGITALANLLFIGGYVLLAERFSSTRTFHAILGTSAGIYAAAWVALRFFDGNAAFYGSLFVAREIGSALMLMHFGAYLQDYFSRDELNRVLPVVYAAGRVGGIGGGAILQWLSVPLGVLNLAPIFVGLCLLCMLLLVAISRILPRVSVPEDEQSAAGVAPPEGEQAASEEKAQGSLAAFLRFVWASPLLFWTTVTSVLFMTIRWVLNYQYNTFFDHHFGDSPEKLAEFLGLYTQVALVLSLVLQLLVVNRLVARLGLGSAYLGYSALVLLASGGNLLTMTLTLAMFSRLVETELRFGLRNPLTQLITNQFSKLLRTRVRAWTMGLLTPLGTALAFVILQSLEQTEKEAWAPWVGVGLAVLYFGGSLGLWASLRAGPAEGPVPAPEPPRKVATANTAGGG